MCPLRESTRCPRGLQQQLQIVWIPDAERREVRNHKGRFAALRIRLLQTVLQPDQRLRFPVLVERYQ